MVMRQKAPAASLDITELPPWSFARLVLLPMFTVGEIIHIYLCVCMCVRKRESEDTSRCYPPPLSSLCSHDECSTSMLSQSKSGQNVLSLLVSCCSRPRKHYTQNAGLGRDGKADTQGPQRGSHVCYSPQVSDNIGGPGHSENETNHERSILQSTWTPLNSKIQLSASTQFSCPITSYHPTFSQQISSKTNLRST